MSFNYMEEKSSRDQRQLREESVGSEENAKSREELQHELVSLPSPGGDSTHDVVSGDSTAVHAALACRGVMRHSMLNMASAQGYINTIKDILARGGDVNATGPDGRTALHCAAYQDQAIAIDVLVAYGAQIDIADDSGLTPLHTAAMNGSCEAVVALLRHGADKSKTNNEGFSPLLMAVHHASLATATVLLHAAEEEDENAVDRRYGEDEYSALDVAARAGHLQLLEMIIRHGADVNAEDSDGVFALYLAALNNQPRCIDLLVNAGARVEARSHGRQGRTALHAACAGGSVEAAKALLVYGAKAFVGDSSHRTPFHLAVENDRFRTVSLILNWDVAHNKTCGIREHMCSAVEAAASRGCVGALKAICESVRNSHPVDQLASRYKRSIEKALGLAVVLDQARAIDVLVEVGASVKAEQECGRTPIHSAVQSDSPRAITTLAQHGADVDSVGRHGRSALQTAAFLGLTNVTEALLKAGAAVDARCVCDEEYHNALDIASKGGHAGVMEALILHGGDVHATDPNKGATALHLAAAFDRAQAIAVLGKAAAKPDASDNLGCTPLHHACVNNSRFAILALVDLGADINTTDNEGESPLHLAAATPGRLSAVRLLLAAGADTTIRSRAARGENTALDLAAEAGHVDVVEALIMAGASVNSRSTDGMTALMHAVKANQASAADTLLKAGANPEAHLNNQSWTSLHSAAEDAHLEVVRVLLKHGANVHARDTDNGNDTPLHVAVRQARVDGAYEIVRALLAHNADESARNNDRQTPECVVGAMMEATAALPVINLLRAAPGDRAWRRRGLLVLCWVRAKKAGMRASANSLRPNKQAKVHEERGIEVGGESGGGDDLGDGGGERVMGQQQWVKTAGTGDSFNGVAVWLLEVREEGLFRAIVKFL